MHRYKLVPKKEPDLDLISNWALQLKRYNIAKESFNGIVIPFAIEHNRHYLEAHRTVSLHKPELVILTLMLPLEVELTLDKSE